MTERNLQNMSIPDILSELVYKDERVWKCIYLQKFVDFKSKRVFENVNLKKKILKPQLQKSSK